MIRIEDYKNSECEACNERASHIITFEKILDNETKRYVFKHMKVLVLCDSCMEDLKKKIEKAELGIWPEEEHEN